MQVNTSPKNGILCKILEILPQKISRPLWDELSFFEGSGEKIFEIRLRRGDAGSALLSSGLKKLKLTVRDDDMNDVLSSLTGGALYAHRDSLSEGYISPFEGLRVGVCARARYDGGVFVGASDISAFIFRISHSGCDFGEELYSVWRAKGSSSLLIYSPPRGGKTSAIRYLAGAIGRTGRHVVAVDERCEFLPSEYKDSELDILRGFKKSKGIEIAVRTLGADMIVVDEIGAGEAQSVLSALMLGVPIIATVHAASALEIAERPAFSPFVKSRAFDTFVGIKRTGKLWRISVSSLADIGGRVKLSKQETLN